MSETPEALWPSEALWYVDAGTVALQPGTIAVTDGVAVRALYSGLSRGTERLVLQGRVPVSEYTRMRCPHQEGNFPFPVKYGYALVGMIESGPDHGRAAFLLHPHQRRARVAPADLHLLPHDLPPRRAVLAANMETAINVLWDARVGPGDRVLVVGGGVLGLLVAALAVRVLGTDVTVTDIDPARVSIAATLGVTVVSPAAAPRDQDVVIHCSASESGLRNALKCAGDEAVVVEASWYGDLGVNVALGEDFHARRLRIVSSQVGRLPAHQRARWSHGRRIALALDLLRDQRFDALITGEIAFADAPTLAPRALAEGADGLMTVLRYT